MTSSFAVDVDPMCYKPFDVPVHVSRRCVKHCNAASIDLYRDAMCDASGVKTGLRPMLTALPYLAGDFLTVRVRMSVAGPGQANFNSAFKLCSDMPTRQFHQFGFHMCSSVISTSPDLINFQSFVR